PIATPSPSPTPTATATASPTPTATATASPTPTPTATASPTPTATASPPPGCASFFPPFHVETGTVYYCSTAAPMPGVTITFYSSVCGGQAGVSTTDSNGQYLFYAPFCKAGWGGYATCSKANQIPGSLGINSID